MNDNKQLTTINKNSKSALIKSKNLLDITKKILDKKELIQTFQFKPYIIEKGHTSSINAIAISPDGKYIVSASSDKTIKIWDFKTAECLNTLEGFQRLVNSIAISPDNKYIVSGSDDNTIKIWDLRTLECLNTLEEHEDSVNSIVISSDGKYIVSGSDDGIIKIWDFKTFKEIYKLDISYKILIDKNGYFNGSDEAIDKYLRVSEEPLTQRKLTSEEIKHFRKKGDFLEIEENIEKLKKYHEMFEIDIDDDEIPF